MEVVKKTDQHIILKKRSGRYAVTGADKKPINGDDKLKILADAGLAKLPAKKPEPAPEAAEEATPAAE